MGTRAEELRQQIESTRSDMTDTLNQVGEQVSPRRIAQRQTATAKRRMQDMRERVMGSAQAVSGSAHSAVEAVHQAPEATARKAQGNPLAAGLIMFGFGLLIGSLVRSTEPEQELATAVVDKARPAVESLREAGEEVAHQAKERASEAVDEVKGATQQAVSGLQEAAGGAAEEIKQSASDAASGVKGRGEEPEGL